MNIESYLFIRLAEGASIDLAELVDLAAKAAELVGSVS